MGLWLKNIPSIWIGLLALHLGCSTADSNTTDGGTESDSTDDTDTGSEDDTETSTDLIADCDEIMAETHWCYGFTHEDIIAVGLESGARCKVSGVDGVPVDTTGIAWLGGDYLYYCDDEIPTHVTRVLIANGTAEMFYLPSSCVQIEEYQGGFLMMNSEFQLVQYDTFEDLVNGQGLDLGFNECMDFTFSVNGNVFYGTWFLGDTVDSCLLPSGELLQTTILEGGEIRFKSIDVTDDGLLVVNDTEDGDRIAVFDVGSGEALWEFPSIPIEALTCVTND